jgi:predicted ATPase
MHFGEAGDIGRTVKYLRLAGEAALRRHAYQESITQLGRALELLDSLPAEEDRDALELELRVLIGVPLLNTRGFAAAEVEATYSRALELCRRRAGTPRLFPVLEGLHTYYAVRGDLRTAWELARQMLDLANASHEPTKMLEAHHTVGTTAFRLAELVTARAHLDQAIAVYDPANGAVAFEQSGHDPRVCCQGYLGVTLWLTGYPDQGLRQALEALAYARTIGHAYTLAVAQSIAAWVHLLRREARQGRSLAESIVALSSEQSFPYYLGLGLMLGGWARTLQGDGEAGLDQLRQGFSICEAIGAGVGRLEYLAMVANSCVRMDRSVEGMAALDEAFALQEAHGERYFAPELHRLRGELLLRAAEPSPGDAEAAFCCALDTARADGTTSLELRAATSLARLLKRDAGARAHVRETLVSVADRFSEGLETADLRDAHAVLREL